MYPIAAIDMQLSVQVVAGRTRCYLYHQFGSTLNITISIYEGLATTGWSNEQQHIWLWLIVQIQPYSAVIAGFDARGASFVMAQPTSQVYMLSAMKPMTHRGWHVDDSCDQFGLFQVRHRLIAAFELSPRQFITILQQRYHVLGENTRHGVGGFSRHCSSSHTLSVPHGQGDTEAKMLHTMRCASCLIGPSFA